VKVEIAARASLALLLTRRIEPITFQQERDRPRSDNRPRPPLSQRIASTDITEFLLPEGRSIGLRLARLTLYIPRYKLYNK